MTSALRAEKFCSSCFQYRPADEVKLVLSANGKQRLNRCNTCTANRKAAKAAKAAASGAPLVAAPSPEAKPA